jgi:hypothetical protein
VDFCDTLTTRGADGAEKTVLGCDRLRKASDQTQKILSALPEFQEGFVDSPKPARHNYHLPQKADKTVSSVSGDLRFSFRFNWQRIYSVWQSQNDFILSYDAIMKLQNTALVRSFEGGCRFKGTTAAFCKHYQKTKLYSKL